MTRQSVRDAMIAHLVQAAGVDDGLDGRSTLPGKLRDQLAADESLLDEWRRLLAQTRALRSLRTRARGTPGDLEGRVVAALQPGHRQDRVKKHMGGLRRLCAPPELDERVRRLVVQPASLPEVPTPAVLDRLVEEEVADIQKSLTRRMTARLARRKAPTDLGRRLRTRAGGEVAERRSRLLPVVVVMVVTGIAWSLLPDGSRTKTPELAFEIVTVSIENAAPQARAIVDGLSGGALGGLP